MQTPEQIKAAIAALDKEIAARQAAEQAEMDRQIDKHMTDMVQCNRIRNRYRED